MIAAANPTAAQWCGVSPRGRGAEESPPHPFTVLDRPDHTAPRLKPRRRRRQAIMKSLIDKPRSFSPTHAADPRHTEGFRSRTGALRAQQAQDGGLLFKAL
ncbi:hypothetical protein GCM10010388_29730 [Streptomyces mauvecolor]